MIIQEKFPSQRVMVFQIDNPYHKFRTLQEKKNPSQEISSRISEHLT